MPDLKIDHDTAQFDFPKATKEIQETLSKGHRSPIDPKRIDWSYDFDAGPDLTGDDSGRYKITLCGKHGQESHRVDCGLLRFRQLPPSIEYVVTVAKEGVMHHNTPHEAVIAWKHGSDEKRRDYLVCAGVEMPNGSIRVAIVQVGAPVFLGGRRHHGEIQRPYTWVRLEEANIAALNDISPLLSDHIFQSEPDQETTFRGKAVRRLTASELRRFNGFIYEGEARVQSIIHP